MFLLFSALLLGILGVPCAIRHCVLKKEKKYSEWDGWAAGLWVIAAILFILSFGLTGAHYSSQISDFEDVQKFDNIEKIYQKKAEVLTGQFAKYLFEAYPQHERDIFKNIKPEKVDIYFVKYPELQASKTIIALTEKINQLQSDRYEQQIKKEQVLKDIRFRLRNPWIWYWFIPEK